MTARAGWPRGRGPAALAAVLLTALWMALASAPASGHALLAASNPADGESLAEAPGSVVLAFTERPDFALTTVRVLDSSGKEVRAGKPEPVPDQPYQLRVTLEGLDQGAYTVTWRTTSSIDGHTTAGSVGFGVGVPAPLPGEAGVVLMDTPAPTPVGVAGRWLFYAGVVLMLGAAVVGVAVAADVASLPRRSLAASWLAAVVGVGLSVADQRASAETSLGNLLSSATGHKLTVQAVAVLAAGAAVAWSAVRRDRAPLVAVGVGAAAAMLARALAGHADASSARWFTVGAQWSHMVSVGVWVGGLVWLLAAMRRGDPGRGRGLARRFSTVAAWALALVVVSGTARALNQVGAWDRLVNTDFGLALLVKLGLFAVLVALGARARFRHVPAAAGGGAGGFRRVVRLEVGLGATLLAATAVMAGFPPSVLVAAASKEAAAAAAPISVTGSDFATTVRVQLVVTPGQPGLNRYEAKVDDYDTGRAAGADRVSLRFQLKDNPDLTPTAVDLEASADQRWRGSGRDLSIAGIWTVTVVVESGSDAVEVPMEVNTRRSGAGSGAPCPEGETDPAYSATVDSEPDPPRLEGTTFRLAVRRDGRPVTGAQVCFAADMPEMEHPGVSAMAREASGGRYDVDMKFIMAGTWSAAIVVAEPGRPVALVPLRIQVR
ncbi:MAG: copper resistance protein CopC [Actinomycetota bacterium]